MSRAWRRFGLVAAGTGAALVALAVLLLAFVHSAPGERFVAGKIKEQAGIHLDGFHMDWPFTLRADYLRLEDERGTWATALYPRLEWHPWRLWRGSLDVDRLVAENVLVERLPEGGQGDGGGFRWPGIAIRVGELSAPVILGEPILGERLGMDVGGTFQMRRGGGSVDLHIRTDGGGLARVAGIAGSDFVDLRWYLRIPSLSRWSRLAGADLAGAANGSGFIAGRLDAPAISGSLEIGPGRAGPLQWRQVEAEGQVIPRPGFSQASLGARMEGPRWGDGQAMPDLSLVLTGDVETGPGRIRLGQARIEGGGARLAASGILERWGRMASLRLDLGARDLGALPGLRDLSGGVWGGGQVLGNLLAPDLRADITLRGRGLATGLEQADHLLGAQPRLDAQVIVGPGWRPVLAPAILQGAKGRLWARGKLGPVPDLWARADIPDLSALGGVSGSAVVQGRVRGSRSVGIVYGADIQGVASGILAFDLNAAAGPLSAQVDVAGRPVAARAVLAGRALKDIVAESQGGRVSGELSFEPDGVRGRLNGSIPELRALGLPLSGRVEAEAVLDPAHGQSVSVIARGWDLPVGEARVESVWRGLSRDPQGEVWLETEGATGRLRAEAVVRPDQAEIRTLTLDKDEHRARLQAPVRLDWGKAVALAPATLWVDGGRVEMQGRAEGRRIQAQARFQALPLGLLELVAPQWDVVGLADGSASLGGSLDASQGILSVTGRNLGFAAAARAGLGRMQGRLDAQWRDGTVQAEAALRDSDKVRAEGSGRYGLQDGTIAANIAFSGDAGRLTEILPQAGHVLAGRVEGEARIAGTVAAPVVDGRAELSNGRYENLEQGTIIANLSAQAAVQGGRAHVVLTGSDGGAGRVEAEATAALDGAWQGLARFHRFTALRRDEVQAVVDGSLDAAGSGGQGRIGGKLAMPRAEVDVGRIKGARARALEVVEINKPGPQPPPRQRVKARPPPVDVALAIDVAVEHAFVRGRGLDSEWQGDITLGGTVAAPAVTGRLNAMRGEFDALGRVFKLSTESWVAFEGGSAGDPSLNVIATTRAEDITARVEISGQASEPQLAVTSEPSLPQDEVLARVLFGREAGKLSAFQQIQLAQMAASGLLGGEGGGFDPVGNLRGLLGLDVLSFGGGEGGSTGPSVSAGRYVGDDTFLRLDQGTQGLGSVTVERELGGGFSVESQMGVQSGPGVGFTWRRDY